MRTLDILFVSLGLFSFSLPLFNSDTTRLEPAVAVTALAPADTVIHNEAFTRAAQAYREADFQKAIDAFSSLAADSLQPRIVRRDALHYLGRAYMAKQEIDRAEQALTDMVGLEPPIIELDPDIEPPRLMRLYYDVRKECNGSVEVERNRSIQTMAVIDFSNHSISIDRERFDPLSKGFTSLIINQLNGATDLKVIERERIQWLLEEQDLQKDPSRVDQHTAVQVGKLLGAHTVLMGSFIKNDKKMILSARLVNVETGEIMIAPPPVVGKADDFFDLAGELSLKVAKSINVSLEDTELGVRRDTQSLDAMISYSEGLDLLEKEEYRAAYEKFIEALDYDPAYKRAELKAQSIEPILSHS